MALKINFTKDAIRDLVCPEGKSEIYVYDTHTKGLAVRVTKAGGKTFYVIRKVNGKDQRRKIDVFDYKSTKLPVIREMAEKVYANLDTIIVAERKKRLRESVTVSEAFESMIANKTKLAKSTIGDYRTTFNNYIKPGYGDMPLSSVTNDIVLELHAKTTAPVLRANGKMSQPRNRSANKATSLLGSIFAYAIVFYKDDAGERIYTYNPVDIMSALGNWHVNKRDKIRVNPNELGTIISNTIEIGDAQPRREVPTSFKTASAAVLFMLFSGVRPGEIEKIRKDYVCHKTRSIVFPPRDKADESDALKNSEEFHLVLNDSAYCQLLYAMKQTSGDYVFAGVDQPKISESNVRDFLTKVSKSLIDRKHLPRKILRASFISIAERAEVGAFYIKVLCNHDGEGQSVDVTDGYKTAYLSEIRRATTKVEEEIYTNAKIDKEYVCRGFLNTLRPLDTKILDSKSVSL
ncbi:integrase family protein [Pseudomonas juntendi]|uniref:integrase family protein n=1 Tax=Pseudomonas juntendi TaxID=2666183 RepID=UPI00294A93F4|nr:integrase family protein [Pseudomonas juntendi]MDV5387623.1 integrase family protein [Pseudomonas juntendi]